MKIEEILRDYNDLERDDIPLLSDLEILTNFRYYSLGYKADIEGDYHTALINFRRAFNLRPGNKYAKEAIHNMERKIRESR